MPKSEIFSLEDAFRARLDAQDGKSAPLVPSHRLLAWIESWPLPLGLGFGLIFWILVQSFETGGLSALIPVGLAGWSKLTMLLGLGVAPFALFGWTLSRTKAETEAQFAEGIKQTSKIQEVSIIGFARISDLRDSMSGNHILRMGLQAQAIAERLGAVGKYKDYITQQYIKDILISAPLHDIGKVGVADNIIKKRGGLSMDEFEMMKMHTIIGGDLMAELERKLPYKTFYTLGKEIAYHHHQKWDGTGYPHVLGTGKTAALFVQEGVGRPLKGDEIPLSARIVAVADVYDALISKRIYKEAYPHTVAKEMIIQERGRHFDPDVVDAFLAIEDKILEVSRAHKD